MSAFIMTDQLREAPSPDQDQGPEGPSFFAQNQDFYREHGELIVATGCYIVKCEPEPGMISRLMLATDGTPTPIAYRWQILTNHAELPPRIDQGYSTPFGTQLRHAEFIDREWKEADPIDPDEFTDLVTTMLGSSEFGHHLAAVRQARADGQERYERLLLDGQVITGGTPYGPGRTFTPSKDQAFSMQAGFLRQSRRGFPEIALMSLAAVEEEVQPSVEVTLVPRSGVL